MTCHPSDYIILHPNITNIYQTGWLSLEREQIIRIYHECEGGIKKIHHEGHCMASQGLPHANNGFFFLFTIKYHIFYSLKKGKAFRRS